MTKRDDEIRAFKKQYGPTAIVKAAHENPVRCRMDDCDTLIRDTAAKLRTLPDGRIGLVCAPCSAYLSQSLV